MTPRKKVTSRAGGRRKTRTARKEVPQFFRLTVEVGSLARARKFYERLLNARGHLHPGSRCYFDCGPVTLQVLDVSSARKPHPAAKALYFTAADLEAVYERAKALGCLATDEVHGAGKGGIVVRPWGERSFYALDPWRNPLCFVEAGTVYGG